LDLRRNFYVIKTIYAKCLIDKFKYN